MKLINSLQALGRDAATVQVTPPGATSSAHSRLPLVLGARLPPVLLNIVLSVPDPSTYYFGPNFFNILFHFCNQWIGAYPLSKLSSKLSLSRDVLVRLKFSNNFLPPPGVVPAVSRPDSGN